MKRIERLASVIRDAGERGISPRDCAALVYDDADGGPDWAVGCVYVLAHLLRKRGRIRVVGCTHKARYYAA